MNYKLLLQLEMEETKRLREELALTKLKLEVAESRIKRITPSKENTENSTRPNLVLNSYVKICTNTHLYYV